MKQTRVYHIFVEGQQEELYFKHLQKLVNNENTSKYRVKFCIKNLKGGSPEKMATKTINTNSVQIDKNIQFAKSLVFDYDFKDEEFRKAINICNKNSLPVFYSIVNFDLWLIFHKKKFNTHINKSDGYVNELIKTYNCNIDIKSEDSIKKILNQIDLSSIREAINRAESLEKKNINDKNILFKNPLIYNQPNLKIYEFVKSILQVNDLID